MLLAVYALALSLILGASNAAPVSAPQLPPTQPGLGHDEGVFLVTVGDNGSQVSYFIAANSRHSVLVADMQLELQANPLWPVRQASQDEVLGFPEGSPVGSAHAGLLGATPAPTPTEASAAAPASDEPATPAEAAAPPPTGQAPVQQPTASPDAADAAQPVQVTLRPGDNLIRIAAQYGTSVDAILAANGLSNANRIYAGATLSIPTVAAAIAEPAEPDAAPANPTPQLAAPAPAQPPVATEAARQSAPEKPAQQPAPADVARQSDDGEQATPADDGTAETAATYTVAPGDSAFKIARRFGIDQGALLEANNISNPNRVYAGQVLTIPVS